ncbi:MAG: response regulator, partial [Deltaproteobacteria bacterium]|nr:response regulator [Deltaproteobacteria bacterium]
MDWQMPGIDGIEASERIKEMPHLDKPPAIVMVTAYGREEVMQKVEKANLDGFLIKPVSPSVLFDTIMQALGEGLVKQPDMPTAAEEELRVLDLIRGARILLVEDNEINRQVAREILKGAGLEVSTANNGQEAIDALQESAYDAVLMDVQMPVMDGYEATGNLRDNPRFKDLPIIAMTAHAMAGDREKSLEAGMNDHVTKPIDPVQLFSTLARWIQSAPKRPSSERLTREVPDRDKVEEPLPVLPGIQFEKGLARLGGNRDLFEKLLLQFRDSHRDTVMEIKTALEADDKELAARLAHTVKGVAANLGGEDLSSSAGALEKKIKEGDARPEDSV